MPISLRTAFVILASIGFCRADHALPGQSVHGESFNDGPRQAAVLLPGCGKINFPISSKNPEAQAFFNQAVGQLHGFWYFEAERSFRQVAALDKECPMAFWGMAMANSGNEKRAKEFIKKATALKAKANDLEKLWIGTLETFYKESKDDKRDKKQRALDYIRDLETIVQDYPNDIEAKAFLVWKTWHANDVAPITSYQAVNALLDQVFAANPEHPAHHYRIHLWDSRKPAQALKSAAVNGQVAPGIAHMWHMPGHTFSKLKRFDDAAWQQEASTRIDHAYMIKNWILPNLIHNYAHNEEWLIRTYNELGRAKDATALAKSLIRTPQHPANNTLDKESNTASYGRTRLIDTLIKWELWDELLSITDSPLIGPVIQPSHEATRLRARGMAYYFKDDPQGLASELSTLEALETKTKEAKAKESKKNAPTKNIPSRLTKLKLEEDKSVAKKEVSGKSDESKKEKSKVDTLAKALADLKALNAVITQSKTAEDMIKKTTDMPKELSLRLWLNLNNKVAATENLSKLPQDLAGLAVKTEAQVALGKMDDAKKTFLEVKKLAFAMDDNLPIKLRLDKLAKTFGETGEWRAKAPKRTDSGTRPSLDSLGPVHWSPPSAPNWQALTLDGKPVNQTQFAGKPHVLLFYLGAACTHCMKQVNEFSKVAADYEKAGISLAAITREPLSLAGRIAEQMSTKKLPPFPVYCDPSLSMFKTFRAFDDFEEEPLHAAVLIDAKGRLRWIDISWEPFSNTSFLLQEAQRLLSLPEE
jgi:alkyl hydroperoxide reductase subunit AhpC